MDDTQWLDFLVYYLIVFRSNNLNSPDQFKYYKCYCQKGFNQWLLRVYNAPEKENNF